MADEIRQHEVDQLMAWAASPEGVATIQRNLRKAMRMYGISC